MYNIGHGMAVFMTRHIRGGAMNYWRLPTKLSTFCTYLWSPNDLANSKYRCGTTLWHASLFIRFQRHTLKWRVSETTSNMQIKCHLKSDCLNEIFNNLSSSRFSKRDTFLGLSIALQMQTSWQRHFHSHELFGCQSGWMGENSAHAINHSLFFLLRRKS